MRKSEKTQIDKWDAEWQLTDPRVSDVKAGEEKTLNGKMSGRSSYVFGVPIYAMSHPLKDTGPWVCMSVKVTTDNT